MMSGRGEKEFKARSDSPGIHGPKPEFVLEPDQDQKFSEPRTTTFGPNFIKVSGP